MAGVLALESLLAAVVGGVIGAAIGALPSLGLAGLAVTAGELADVLGPSSGGDAAGSSAGSPLVEFVGLGPLLGPHVAFAGGVAAAAYAGRKGYVDPDTDYHVAKHLATPPGLRPGVLAVGAVFGVFGHLTAGFSAALGLPWSPIWASVVVSAACHRVVFGYPLLGRAESDRLDMTPFERGRRRTGLDGSPDDGTHRYIVEPWLPAYWEWPTVAVLGATAGPVSAALAVLTGSHYLAFGLATASLVVFTLDSDRVPADTGAVPVPLDRVPVTHHVVLPASLAALAVPSLGPAVAVALGTVFGVLGGLCGEIAQRLLYAHADTHFDPAAVSIVVTTFLLAVLDALGIFAGVPVVAVALG